MHEVSYKNSKYSPNHNPNPKPNSYDNALF